MEKVSSGASVKSRPLGSKATTTCKPNIAFLFFRNIHATNQTTESKLFRQPAATTSTYQTCS
jgi:hypothetical protein